MAVATGELYQVTLVLAEAGQTVENVLMFRERTGISTTAQIVSSVKNFWSIYRAIIVDDCTVQELRAKRMTPIQLDAEIFQPTTGQEAGGHGGDPINNMVALVTTLRTGTAGKRHRGRVYSPGVPAGSTTDATNKANGTFLGEVATMWATVLTQYGDASGTDPYLALGIYSRVIGGTHPYTVAGWQAVTQMVPRQILGSQRRRREGVGA
jgi:hypothetical protein